MEGHSLPSTLSIFLRNVVAERQRKTTPARRLSTGLEALDRLMPGDSFVRGAVHEVLAATTHPLPYFIAAVFARAAVADGGVVAWLDLRREVYPPALAAAGVPLERLYLLRPMSNADAVRAVVDCCRCKMVAATVAELPNLSRVEVRRLQLAAEHGGGMGVFLRRRGVNSTHYAAATRWMVTPRPGNTATRRWEIQLLHGHGGRVGQSAVVEVCRETNDVRAFEALAHRPAASQAAPASA